MNAFGFHCAGRVCLLLFFFIPLSSLASEERKEALVKKPHIEWTLVEGVKSYEIQIRNERGETVLSKVTDSNRVELDLLPGEYHHRVGTVNKFGKVSAWTPWKPYKVIPTARPYIKNIVPGGTDPEKGTQVLIIDGINLDENTNIKIINNQREVPVLSKRIREDGKTEITAAYREAPGQSFSLLAENPGGLHNTVSQVLTVRNDGIRVSSDARRIKGLIEPHMPDTGTDTPDETAHTGAADASRWMILIPGLPAMQRGSYFTGALWVTAFAALSAYGTSYTALMNKAESALTQDPFILASNDPLYFSIFNPYMQTGETRALVQMLSSSRYAALRKSYNNYNISRQITAGAALTGYTAHLFMESPGLAGFTTPLPGIDQMRNGRYFSGSLFLAGFTGSLAYGASSASSAEKIASGRRSDFTFRLLHDPVFIAGAASILPDQAVIRNLVVLNYIQNHQSSAAYQSQIASMNAGFAAAAGIYLLHLADALVLRPGRPQTGSAAGFFMKGRSADTEPHSLEMKFEGFAFVPSGHGGIEAGLIFSF